MSGALTREQACKVSCEQRGEAEPFSQTLSRHGLTLTRGTCTTLQVNVGYLCNQSCKHCHLSAGPDRTEVMSLETVEEVASFAERAGFQVIDITGGAPELNPHFPHMMRRFSGLAPRLMLRCNLTALRSMEREVLNDVVKAARVVIVCSVPSLNRAQLEAQRGRGVWQETLDSLRMLNEVGYGRPGSGLELNLVCNPPGAFLPGTQAQVEEKFRSDLQRKWGIVFDNLYTFANAPLGRFRDWLIESGNYAKYMTKLVSGFNPCTIEGLMCRSLVSVSWDGCLYDCDFNLAKGIPLRGARIHVSQLDGPPAAGTAIAVSDHCYACTAGSGFT